MQSAHRYPSHRRPHPVYWLAKAGATVDDAPLPRTTAARNRTVAIRTIFLSTFAGRATIHAVGARCDELGLLDSLSTIASAYETVMVALRPICTRNYWESARYAATLSPQSAAGEPGVTPGSNPA